MKKYAFPPHDPVCLAIAGSDERFPVRRIYCIGRNYADHVKEMGGDTARSEPIFFTKAAETYGVGIDLTRRDLQAAAKKKGAPWARAKNFHQSAPCSALTPAEGIDLSKARIVLRKNGDIVQHGALSQMIWGIDEIIERLSADMDPRR